MTKINLKALREEMEIIKERFEVFEPLDGKYRGGAERFVKAAPKIQAILDALEEARNLLQEEQKYGCDCNADSGKYECVWCDFLARFTNEEEL